MMKMELKRATVSFAKGKAKAIKKLEEEFKEKLDELDKIICNS